MFFRFLLFIMMLSVFSILQSSSSFAENALKLNHKILQKFKNNGGKIQFLGNAYGMDGWVVINPAGRAQYVYTNDQGALVEGMLFGPDGKLETVKEIKAFKERAAGGQGAVPGAENSKALGKAERFYAEVEKSNWVALGDRSAPYIYTFINTSCRTCQNFWKKIEQGVNDNRVQVRLIPTGKKTDNYNGGAALLSSKDPYKAWVDTVNGDKNALNIKNIKKENYDKMNANNDLAAKWKIPDTPFILYRKTINSDITAIVGIPENMMLLYSDIIKIEHKKKIKLVPQTKAVKKVKNKKKHKTSKGKSK